MHEVAVRIVPAEWREWLRLAGDTRRLRCIEVSGDLLAAASPELPRAALHLGLELIHVADVIPPSLSCYLGEMALGDDEGALAALCREVTRGLPEGVRFASLDLGLDRLALSPFEEGFRRRVLLMRALRRELFPRGTTAAVRVRLPRPFAGSRQWEWAANLLHELGEPRCRTALDVMLSDLAQDLDADSVLRDAGGHAGVVRLHYRWRGGEQPDETTREQWSAALRRHPGPLAVVFCPWEPTLDSASGLLADIERWAAALEACPRRAT